MSTRTATLEADLATIPGYPSATAVVALPPTSLDVTVANGGGGFGAYAEQYAGTTTTTNGMRVYVGGVLVLRAFDLALETP